MNSNCLNLSATKLPRMKKMRLGVSVISCWEVTKLVELKRLNFSLDVFDWINQALSYPGIQLIELSARIAVESTKLPGEFHRDPADQIVVAIARVHDCPLLTLDEKFLRTAM